MSKLEHALSEIHHLDTDARKDQGVNRIHPLVKLAVTVCFITVTASFYKYDLAGLLRMGVYPIAVFIFGEVSFKNAVRRLRIVLPAVCLLGVFNPVFDRQPVMESGGIIVTAGILSMFTLMVKGVYSVLASYLFIASSSIESICHALRMIHVPSVIVTQILLTYRYISLLVTEADRMMQAYMLRAPNQKGVHIKAWGSFAGQLLLRSMDRADEVYESMMLRGYRGEFGYAVKLPCRLRDIVYLAFWCAVFFCCRVL